MLIIIEGCDGVGKTTLANALADEMAGLDHSVEVIHYGPPVRHPLDEYELDLIDYAPGRGQSIITDRYHLGELVYAPLYRAGSELGGFGGTGRAHVELFLAARGAVIVHVDGNEQELRERLEERGEDYLDLKDIDTVLYGFRKAAATALCPVVRVPMWWDTTDVNRILIAANEAERGASKVWSPSYVGTVRPKVIFFGVLHGQPVPFMPHDGTSGQELFRRLGWRQAAVSGFASVELARIEKLHSQSRAKIVAVGKITSKILDSKRIAHGAIIDPIVYLHSPKKRVNAMAHYNHSIQEAIKGKRFTWAP